MALFPGCAYYWLIVVTGMYVIGYILTERIQQNLAGCCQISLHWILFVALQY